MSSLQLNLLPDSKLEFNRIQYTKRLATSISFIVVIVSVAILLLMLFVVDVVQKKQMSDASAQLDKSSKQLDQLNVNKVITVQNQLQTLVGLHQDKHITSRIFTYLPKITPASVTINKLDVDLTSNTMNISGTAGSQKDVNTFIDSLKFATYTIGNQGVSAPAFQSVVESGFSISTGSVGYTIDLNFDPKLFTNDLKDSQGNFVNPQISVNNPPSGSSLSPSNTLFNSSQTSNGGNQ